MSNGPPITKTIRTLNVLGTVIPVEPGIVYYGQRLCAHVQLTESEGQYHLLVDSTQPDSFPAGTLKGETVISTTISIPRAEPFYTSFPDGLTWDGSPLACHITINGDDATLSVSGQPDGSARDDDGPTIQLVIVNGTGNDGSQELYWVDVPADAAFTTATIAWTNPDVVGLGGPIGGVTIP